MFVLNNREVQAPVTTPIFPTPANNSNITTYVEGLRANDPNTQATIGALLMVFVNGARSNTADALRTNCRNMFNGDAYNAVHNLMAAGQDPAQDDNDRLILAIAANGNNAIAWFVNLCNAAKKKPITDTNVEGFFNMLGHHGTKAGPVVHLINSAQVFFPDQINNAPFRALLAEGIWTTYRNTRVSSGAILKALLPDFRALRITTDGDGTEIAINNCANAPWNIGLSLAIPDKYKAYGSIFLQVAGTPIDDWIQGNKAVSAMPAAKVRSCREIFRKYLEVKSSVTGLDAFATVQAFTDSDEVRDFF